MAKKAKRKTKIAPLEKVLKNIKKHTGIIIKKRGVPQPYLYPDEVECDEMVVPEGFTEKRKGGRPRTIKLEDHHKAIAEEQAKREIAIAAERERLNPQSDENVLRVFQRTFEHLPNYINDNHFLSLAVINPMRPELHNVNLQVHFIRAAVRYLKKHLPPVD